MMASNADGDGEDAPAGEADDVFATEAGLPEMSTTSTSPRTRTTVQNQSVMISMTRVGERNMPKVQDHFSLPAPSSEVRFRRSNVRVYEQPNSQFILQEHATVHQNVGRFSSGSNLGDGASTRPGDNQNLNMYVTVKETSDSTYGLTFLRATYSLIAVFMGGFLFIFGLVLLLFLFIDLATALGLTSGGSLKAAAFVAIIFSIPVFVYSLSMVMSIATRFVVDTWNGHPFLRTFGNWSVVVTDWVAFTMYLGIPLLTFICTLMMRLDDWWAISLITWFCTVILFWSFFAGCVIYYEVHACLYLIGEANQEVKDKNLGIFGKIKLAIVHGHRIRLGGVRRELYMVDGNMVLPEDGSYTDSDVEPHMVRTSLYSKITQLKCLGCIYEPLDPPKRQWTIDEVRGNVPFITKHSWSLEKLFCMGGRAASIPVVAGPSAITKKEATSSFVCAVLGNIIFILLVVGLLVWLGVAGAILGIIIAVIILCCIPEVMSIFRLKRLYNDVSPKDVVEENNDEDDVAASEEEAVSSAIYQVWEAWKLNKPTATFTWIFIALEVIFLYLWPLIHMAVLKNAPSTILFLFLGIFSGVRYFLSTSVLLQGIGNFGSIGLREGEALKHKGLLGVKSKREWVAKSRLSQIVGIGNDKSLRFWNMIYTLLVIFFVVVVIGAVATTDKSSTESDGQVKGTSQTLLVSGFAYERQPNLPYPTCRLKKGLEIPGGDGVVDLSDIAFVAGLAYVKMPDSQIMLDQWFGAGVATDNVEVIDDFVTVFPEYSQSAASYKLITFRDTPTFAVVSIRGTATLWDLMADAQLWLSAGLFQGLRELLPLGEVWTPTLHKMVKFVSALEADSTSQVAYYKETTKFVKYLKENTEFTTVQVTGHSLGGGLALITGAQSDVAAVGLSAPNAMLSRETFDPPLTKEQLNTLTLNIVPVGDLIPMLDDKANLFQNIECRADANDIFGCHSSTRSLCEIMYTCGSEGRPVVCNCTADYDYPQPIPTGNQTNFTQACIEAAVKMEVEVVKMESNFTTGGR